MKLYEFEGKTQDDLEKIIEASLNTTKNNLIIKYTEEEKTGLFKGKKTEAKVLVIEEVIDEVKEKIKKITKLMNIEANIEVKKEDEIIKFSIYSDNNAILIGKNGRTLDAIQTIIKQSFYNNYRIGINILIDIEDYKEKQQKNIELIAKKTAKEVSQTKIEAKLFDMNSYERRLVHATLTNFDGVYTESEGSEPNRYVIIKPKEEK